MKNGREYIYEKYGIHGIHASDEWYLLAERFLPEEERYDGYLQLENGVGMLRLLETEFLEALEVLPGDKKKRELSMATGRLAAPVIENTGRTSEQEVFRIRTFMCMLFAMSSLESGLRYPGCSPARI